MREIKTNQDYLGKTLKLIPTEVIMVYLTLQGLIQPADAKWGLMAAFIVGLAVTPLYLIRALKIKDLNHVIAATASFAIWVYSLGGPFPHFGIYKSWVASALLFLWTFSIPWLYKKNGQSIEKKRNIKKKK